MNNDKVLILGVTGMAGHIIYNHLSSIEGYEVIGTSNRKSANKELLLLDVTDFNILEIIIKRIQPKYIINAVGVLINRSESDVDNAILINSYFPHFLVRLCRKYGSKLIHISTDCVFSGKEGEYKENDFRDADDIYGRSKALGEINNKIDVTIRTSIIGPELKDFGEGLFHWFMSKSVKLSGYNNVFWSGVTTLELAKNIDTIIRHKVTGIYHLTNNNKISKYALLVLFNNIWNRNDLLIDEVKHTHKDKSFINTMYPELIVRKSYEQMLIELYEFMKLNRKKFNYDERYRM